MNKLEQIINEFKHFKPGKYPKESTDYIIQHIEEAKPYLYESIDTVIKNNGKISDEYSLYIFALFILAQVKDKQAFPKITQLTLLNNIDYLLGDILTEDLKNIFYSTFDGNYNALIGLIKNYNNNEYVSSAALYVLCKLYEDGKYSKEEILKVLDMIYQCDNELLYSDLPYIYSALHFYEYLERIKDIYVSPLYAPYMGYSLDEVMDNMFNYDDDKEFCAYTDIHNDFIKLGMFEKEKKENLSYEKFKRKHAYPIKKIKIGRNDPCPCGSGKKYKKCCMNKSKSEIDNIEDFLTRQKYLQSYPKAKNSQYPDRIYLSDYYDEETIELDKIIYLGLNQRNSLNYAELESFNDTKKRKINYLSIAYKLLQQRLVKLNINSFKEYDSKYAIHYTSLEWLNELLMNTTRNGQLYNDIENFIEKYS